MPTPKTTHFRTEIEGLRAVAVLPILLFHLDPSWAPGGYVGVDIFFVISGYLISGQILKAGPNQFRFLTFYWRRVRRLLPALAVTVAVTLAFGWRLLTPDDFKSLAWSSIASLFGVSNIYFYSSVDYFNDSSLLHPLLHTWSLGVEEQFYLIWPALLVSLMVLSKRWLTSSLLAIGILSLAASVYFTYRAPHLAFYMMPFRIFEFSIGALAFILVTRPSRTEAMLYGIAGAGLLAITIFMFDSETPWPAANALLPCIGTVLLLIAGRDGLWHTILSVYPLRFVGRISYSVYLVHWPLIVLYRTWAVVPPTLAELIALFFASILFGAMLYAFVERYYRISPEPKVAWLFIGNDSLSAIGAKLEAFTVRWQHYIFGLFLIVPILSVCFSAFVIARDGVPERMKKGRVQQTATTLSFAGDLCSSLRNRCAFGDVTSKRIVYLVGDSHALNLVYGLDRLFKEAGIRGIALYDHGCLYLKGTQRFIRGVRDRSCAENVALAYKALELDRHPVIFAGDYSGYVKSIGLVEDGAPYNGEGADYIAWIDRHFRGSLDAIDARNRPVVILSTAYHTGINTAKCAMQFGASDVRCTPATLAQARRATQDTDKMIDGLREHIPTLTIIDPKSAFCTEDHCVVRDKDTPFFRDTTHLTNEGSAFLISRLKHELLGALRAQP